MSGEDGDDTLIAGFGQDDMNGGNGNDLFLFASGTGYDLIEDFQAGRDRIGLTNGLTVGDLTIATSPTDSRDSVIQVTRTGEYLAVIDGVSASDLDSSDFQVF